MADFVLESWRGGLNESDPPTALAKDACVTAENVEFHKSTCGEKRLGTANVTLPAIAATMKAVPFMFRHLPSADESAAELWALFTPSDGTQAIELWRKTTAWTAVTMFGTDSIDVTTSRLFRVRAASLHGKLFLAFKSTNSADRLHVWDGTSLRRVGLVAPAAAPAVATAGVGTFTGKRYYRVRFTVQNGSGTTILRSEPSATTTFTPGGLGLSARITKPAASSPSEGETHWEVEASINNGDFYRLSTVVVGTTTYDDSIAAYTTGYAASGTLSEDIGDYTLPWSAKFVTTDDDRVIFAGAWENSAYGSRVAWTPVTNDPGSGNDERIPIDTDQNIDLDANDGGEITGISRSMPRGNDSVLYVFKLGRIYTMTRTQIRAKAYNIDCVTKARGALPGSLIEGVDESGQPALYFLDVNVGPCRIGASGILQNCGFDVFKTTWKSVNVDATHVCHGVHYAASRQTHWWLATGTSNTPTKKIVLQVNEQQAGISGLRRGWSTWSSGRSVSAWSSVMFASNIDAGVARSLVLVPFVGLSELAADRNLIQRCDTGTTDSGSSYTATIKSRPFILASLMNKFGAMAGALLGKAASGVTVSVRVIRDFGLQSSTARDCLLTPTSTEDQVIVPLDNLFQSEMKAMQIEIGDLNANGGAWEVNMIAMKERPEESA